jgi:hypothetical protein
MATGKGNKPNQSKRSMDWGGGVRNNVAPRSNNSDSTEHNVPWVLLIAIVVLLFVFVIIIPVWVRLGSELRFATEQANVATERAIQEINRMRRFQKQMFDEQYQPKE